MTNKSGILPTEYKVLIEPIEVQNKIGSIYIPDETKDRDQYAQMKGILVAASPLAFTYDDWKGNDSAKPKPGDTVLFAKCAGAVVDGKDGKKYRLANDKDIAAVLA
jgi:co-chaperonin GroES (HSP10)